MSKDPFIGKLAGKCRILELIGEGGTAYVYRAHNEAFQMERVVKVLKRELAIDQDFFPKFQQEAQLVARLDHPNILRVFDTGIFEEHFYIEMEFIHGMTLREYQLRHHRIPEKTVLELALQITKALHYAHEAELTTPDGVKVHGILHLDLKPENIMITPTMEVKLMDFGAAKMLVGPGPASNGGEIFGTLAYMSPEQIAGLPVDVKSDYFSFGSILYEMIAGRKAFGAEQPEALMAQVREGVREPLRKYRRAVSPWTEELVDKLLALKPSHRPHSAAEIERELNVCTQLFKVWGTGARLHVPFSVRKHFPSIAMLLSIIALCLSTVSFVRTCSGSPIAFDAAINMQAQQLIDQGLAMERAGEFRQAVEIYSKVPEGMREYPQAQARIAMIQFRKLERLSAARATLENLGEDDDPFVNMTLGQIYYQLAKYPEARARIEAAIESSDTPVLPISDDDKDQMRYFLAWSWDKEYQLLGKDPKALEEAIKAWSYYFELANCSSSKTKRCNNALSRKELLAKALK